MLASFHTSNAKADFGSTADANTIVFITRVREIFKLGLYLDGHC